MKSYVSYTFQDPSKVEKMGQRDGFSKGDITKINAMYGCPEKTAQVTGSKTTTAPPVGTTEQGPTNPLQYLLSLFFKKK